MTDKEKLSLINNIIADAWEYRLKSGDNTAFYEGVISSVYSVLVFGEEGEG